MSRVMIEGDGVTLEADVQTPEEPAGTLVLCHPHPEHGGTMRAPILGTITRIAVTAGFAVVRFNFRGVGASTGSFDGGIGEIDDVNAAVRYAAGLGRPVAGIAGWSFGAATALAWQASEGSTLPYVGIAPPVASPLTPHLPKPDDLAPAARLFIVGERDQFVDVEGLDAYAASIGAAFLSYPSTDHFFVFRDDRLADDVAGFLVAQNADG